MSDQPIPQHVYDWIADAGWQLDRTDKTAPACSSCGREQGHDDDCGHVSRYRERQHQELTV